MLSLRSVYRFCRAKVYIERFKSLEEEVNRRQKELLQKKEQLDDLIEINKLTPRDRLVKSVKSLLNLPFETEAMAKQKDKIHQLKNKLEILMKESQQRQVIASKLKNEEQIKRQNIFLADVGRFSGKYQNFASSNSFRRQVHEGLELSVKNLDTILQKYGAQWIGNKSETFNPQKHERVSGEGDKIKTVKQRGFRIKGELIEKAKVETKK